MLAQSPKWEEDLYGFAPDGIGDCIFRSAIAAMAYYDHDMLSICATLLNDGIRWPYLLDPPTISGKKRYRSQKSLTRDPFIMTWCAKYNLTEGSTYHLRALRMPWWLYRPYINSWVRYLVATGDRNSTLEESEKLKKRFEGHMLRLLWWGVHTRGIRAFVEKYRLLRWTRSRFGLPGYSLHLFAWMAYTAGSNRLKDKLVFLLPHWNLLLWALVVGPPTHEPYISEVKEYRSRKGYQWTAEDQHEDDYLPEYESCYLDMDILEWVINRQS